MKKLFILFTILIFTTTNAFAISNEAILEYNQGIDYYKLGQYENAIASFRTAIKLDPNYIDAYYNLGTVYESLHQYDAALSVFKQIIVRKPEDYDSVYKAAWLSYKLGEVQKAKTYLGIIPPNCNRSKDAQALMAEMNYNSPTVQVPKATTVSPNPIPQPTKQVQQLTPTATTNHTNTTHTVVSKLNQTNGIYQNIPAPTGITSDRDGNIYVAEFNNNAILKITPDNKKIIFLKDPKVSGPIGLDFDKSQNLYIANYNKDNILKVSKDGQITVLISNIKKPYYVYIDSGMLFVSCQGSSSVLRYKIHN